MEVEVYLLSFPGEYYGDTFRLGFVDDEGEAAWFEMTVGISKLGRTAWKQGDFGNRRMNSRWKCHWNGE